MADKVSEIVLDALKSALGEPGEQRLFRSGKLAGLFPARSGANAEAAAWALGDGLLEVVRTESRGKLSVDWVRPTPRAVDFVHDHESPRRAMEDLRTALQASREAVPVWLAEMRGDLQALASRLSEEAQRWTHRLDTLSQRVEEALRRAEAGESPPVKGQGATIPWASEALGYLDRRRDSGAPGHCPLPELFAALRHHHAELSMKGFHEGLRRLHDRRALRLLPFTGQPNTLPEPEYALLDGGAVLYYATRAP
jgi:hypothetical protein